MDLVLALMLTLFLAMVVFVCGYIAAKYKYDCVVNELEKTKKELERLTDRDKKGRYVKK